MDRSRAKFIQLVVRKSALNKFHDLPFFFFKNDGDADCFLLPWYSFTDGTLRSDDDDERVGDMGFAALNERTCSNELFLKTLRAWRWWRW